MIEVWENLDCESVGASEVKAIEIVVADQYGVDAVDPLMRIARVLADEGAHLRHAELIDLYTERAADRTYESAIDGLLCFADLRSAVGSIRSMEHLRRNYRSRDDRKGLRILRQAVLDAKEEIKAAAKDLRRTPLCRQIDIEIVQWLSLWLQTPELFEQWIEMRQTAPDFIESFGRIRDEKD